MRIEMPCEAEWIIKKIRDHGFEAFAVGGCVRDTLLGREPGDWDITTSARPEEVKAIFGKTVDTGLKHGTVTIIKNHKGYEVTTYRIDGEYRDGRHPDSVEFTASLSEDLKRRDFTINAMAYSHETGIVDEFGGMEDLEAGIVRCVGCAHDRFTEDALRILRAVRFAAQLGFVIEEKTYRAISDIAPNLKKVSKERIQVELTKLLVSGHPEKIAMVEAAGISPYVTDGFSEVFARKTALTGERGAFPGVSGVPGDCGAFPGVSGTLGEDGGTPGQAGNSGSTGEPAFRCLRELPAEKSMRWAGFLRHMPPAAVRKILKGLKLDNETIGNACAMAEAAQTPLAPEKAKIRRFLSRMTLFQFDGCLRLKALDGAEGIPEIRALQEEILRDGDCISLKTLAVGGNDLMAAGVEPGKEVGEALKALFSMVLEDPSMNEKETLLKQLKR